MTNFNFRQRSMDCHIPRFNSAQLRRQKFIKVCMDLVIRISPAIINIFVIIIIIIPFAPSQFAVKKGEVS